MIGNPVDIQEEITNSVMEFKAIKVKSKLKVSKLMKAINIVGLLGFVGGYIAYGLSGLLTAWLIGSFVYFYAIYRECYWEKTLGVNIPIDRLGNILMIPEVRNALIEKLKNRKMDTQTHQTNIQLLKAKDYLINNNINEAITILLNNEEFFLNLDLEDKLNEAKSMEIGRNNQNEKTYKNMRL